ncbi:S1C family serine protease [Candidatus Nitrosocosmicus agrestis]|uniref:S1C family serine protease n=1 Tax=Candidatus Nitrosocosmicus agrestis TaxID=2563600 RepID=UPI00125144EE|nr:trypsin-like peptidase domain-containing protein [Candidatus Nitrosocosmicus sp. SS]KAA2282137.1 trypsin-like serine protease [Candidatus Nitrosocosmicus sp. SS]
MYRIRLFCFIIFFSVCVILFQLAGFAYAQSNEQSLEEHLGLFANGNTSLLNDVFDKVKDSVVQISTEYQDPNSLNSIYDSSGASPFVMKFGSGFIYDDSGIIITNYHVISSASNIIVTFNNGNSYTAKVVGVDPYGDISILKIDNPMDEKLVPVAFSNSSLLKVGDPVLAIGNPYGLDNTLTFGIVSQIGRLLPNSDLGYSIPNVIQTDAAINPGNSGGPLIDLDGKVVGMNTAIFSNTGAYTGVGFAIPSNDIMRIIPSLLKSGTYQHPWLGISGSKLSPTFAEAFGLPHNYKGVLIEDVVPNGPADKAGLQGMLIQGNRFGEQQILDKDIIIAIDNHPVSRIDDIISYLDINKKVGDKINLSVNRNGQIINLVASLEARPDLPLQEIQSQSEPDNNNNIQPNTPFPNFKLPQLPDFKLPDFKLPGLAIDIPNQNLNEN